MRLNNRTPKQPPVLPGNFSLLLSFFPPCAIALTAFSASSFALSCSNMTSPLTCLKPCHGSTVSSNVSQHGVAQPCFPLQLHRSAVCVTFNPQPHNPISGPLTLAHAVFSSWNTLPSSDSSCRPQLQQNFLLLPLL